MHAKEIKNQKEEKIKTNLSLVPLTGEAKRSLWNWLTNKFLSPDLNYQEWERLEMKRPRNSEQMNQWRGQ